MAFLKRDTVKGHDYYRIMESYRDPVTRKVKKRTLLQIGRTKDLFTLLQPWTQKGKPPPPEESADPSDHTKAVPLSDAPDHDGTSSDESDVNKGQTSSESVSSSESSERNPAGQTTDDLPELPPGFGVDAVRCREHGNVHLLYSVAEWLGVRDLMESNFPPGSANGVKRAQSLLLAAIHRACDPGSKSQFADWFRHTSFADRLKLNPDLFTSQHFYEQMDKVTVEQIKKFETALYRRILDQFPEVEEALKQVSIDFTNYFTFIANRNYRCQIAQYGHSKENRHLRIVSVAVITTPLLGIPIATMVYQGNFNDKTALALFIDDIKARLSGIIDMTDITFVFDGGGVSEDVLNALPGHFITRGSIKNSPELYEIPISEYQEYELMDGRKVKAYRTTATQFGKVRPVIISLSDELRDGQVRELDKRFTKFEEQVAEINVMLGNPRARSDKRLEAVRATVENYLSSVDHAGDFVQVTYKTEERPDPEITKKFQIADKKRKKEAKKDPGTELKPININGMLLDSAEDIPKVKIVISISVATDKDKKDEMIKKYYGKHLLTMDRDDRSTVQTLEDYRGQEVIERFFRDSKTTSHFSVRPIFHYTDQKIKVHVMLCYLGLTLTRVAQYMLKTKLNYNIDTVELMKRLERVQECLVFIVYNNEKFKPTRVISELEPKEKETWDKVVQLIEYMDINPAKIIIRASTDDEKAPAS